MSERLKNEIRLSLEESFGPIKATVFGSRADDTRRGGDIDIAVSSDLSRKEFRAGKAAFFASLMRKGFDLPIDLVRISEASPLLQKEIHRSGVPLCRNLAQQAKQMNHG